MQLLQVWALVWEHFHIPNWKTSEKLPGLGFMFSVHQERSIPWRVSTGTDNVSLHLLYRPAPQGTLMPGGAGFILCTGQFSCSPSRLEPQLISEQQPGRLVCYE